MGISSRINSAMLKLDAADQVADAIFLTKSDLDNLKKENDAAIKSLKKEVLDKKPAKKSKLPASQFRLPIYLSSAGKSYVAIKI